MASRGCYKTLILFTNWKVDPEGVFGFKFPPTGRTFALSHYCCADAFLTENVTALG